VLVLAAGVSVLSLGSDVALAGASGAAYVLFAGVCFWLLIQSSRANLTSSFSAKVRPYLGLFCAALPLITLLSSLDLGIVSPVEWAGVAFAGLLAFVVFLALRVSFSSEAIGA
jgi:hypothetical protein